MTVNEIVIRVTEIALTDYSPKRANTRVRYGLYVANLWFQWIYIIVFFFLIF